LNAHEVVLLELMELYHVTDRALELGDHAVIEQPRVKEGEREEKENNLERFRPADKPSRKTSYFGFACIADAISFADAEKSLQKGLRNFYKIRMQVDHCAPMALASAARNSHPQLEAVCREYWNPTNPWQLWEHLGATVTVLARLDEPADEMAGLGLSRMTQDKQRIRQLFGAW
jgi:hypothetical protein